MSRRIEAQSFKLPTHPVSTDISAIQRPHDDGASGNQSKLFTSICQMPVDKRHGCTSATVELTDNISLDEVSESTTKKA